MDQGVNPTGRNWDLHWHWFVFVRLLVQPGNSSVLSHRTSGVMCCVVPQQMSLEIQICLLFCFMLGVSFAFQWFSALSSVRSHSPRTKVSLSLFLSPHPSSNSQFPWCFGKSGLSVALQMFAESVVMAVPYGRERAGREQGEAAWAGRGSAAWAAEVACRFSCGKHLPHLHTSTALPRSDLPWIAGAKPGKSSLFSVPLLLVFQELFQPHSIPRKWGCLGKLWCMRHPACLPAWHHWVQEWISKVAVLVHSSKVWSGKHFWTWVSLNLQEASCH